MWTVSSRLRKEKMALGAGGGRERSRVAGAEVRERGASKRAGRVAGMRGQSLRMLEGDGCWLMAGAGLF
jgi:hypothetical protein